MMSTVQRRSPGAETLEQFEAALRARADEAGLPSAPAPELVESCFRGGGSTPSSRLGPGDLPGDALGLRIGRFALVLGILPERPNEGEVVDRLRRYRNQCVVARSYLASDEALDLHLLLVGPRGSERSGAWRPLALAVERDDKVARKLVWLRPDDGPEVAEADRASFADFVRRTFLGRPWKTQATFTMAPLDSVGRGVALDGVPRDTTGDWNRLALQHRSDPVALVDGLVEAWARRSQA